MPSARGSMTESKATDQFLRMRRVYASGLFRGKSRSVLLSSRRDENEPRGERDRVAFPILWGLFGEVCPLNRGISRESAPLTARM